MNKKFRISIIVLILAILSATIGIYKCNLTFIILGSLFLILGIILFKNSYEDFVISNRKSKRWCKPLSDKELEIVEDAKKLIKKVDSNIQISEFNVYKISFSLQGFFYYDVDTKELCIFIPFTVILLIGGKNLCFLAVLHEVLHSQNLRNNNVLFFEMNFLEGLNQLLAIWLIENYSEKYKIPKKKYFSLRLTKNLKLKLTINHLANTVYTEEVRLVKEVLKDNNLKEVFINYIDMKPEFFKSFVPLEYLKNQ